MDKIKLFFNTILIIGVLNLINIAHATEAEPTDKMGQFNDTFEGLPDFIEAKMKEWEVPGLAIGVVKGDQILFLEGFGFRDVQKNLPVTPQTLFKIGSVTKPITALSVGMLVDEGKLDWDTPIIEYVKDFRLSDDYAAFHTTLRDILCHRTGLPGHYLMIRATNFNREELVSRLRYLDFNAGFREIYQYNNLMYTTAGFVIDRVSGSTWEEFVTERIFEPLGMSRSNFSFSDLELNENYSLPYESQDGKVRTIALYNNPASAPAGGIISSAEEMLAWLKVCINEGKVGDKQLISKDSLIEMFSPQIPIRFIPDSVAGSIEDYGMGWTIRPYRNHYLVHHGGWIDGFVSWVSIMPVEKIGVVVLSNKGHQLLPFFLNYHIYHRLLGLDNDWTINLSPESGGEKKESKPGEIALSKPTHPLNDFAGLYEHPGYGQIEVIFTSGTLEAIFNHSIKVPLRHLQYNIFVSEHNVEEFNNLRFNFPVSTGGALESLHIPLQPEVNGRGIGDIIFTRIAAKSLFSQQYLQRFIGLFEYQGLQVKIELDDQKKLLAQVPGQGVFGLEPFSENIFKLLGTDWEHSRIEFTIFDDNGLGNEALVYLKEGSIPVTRIY